MECFDYVVVGGGASGGVIASRLSENPKITVLLIEAGSDHRSDVESMHKLNPMALWADPKWTWQDVMMARTSAQPLRPYPVGRCVGGGSSVNGMGWIWGQPADFDSFESEYGCQGWGWRSLESVHHKIEDQVKTTRISPDRWGKVASAMRSGAVDSLGFVETPDLNAPGATGVSAFPMNFDSAAARRSGVAEAYLTAECRARPNLAIRGECAVAKLWFAGNDTSPVPNALGVILRDGGRVRAKRETVLCCGALLTPALLYRSGVGPEHELARLGVPPVLFASAVGTGFQDHPVINGRLYLRQDSKTDHDSRHACALARFSSPGRHNDLYFVSVEQSNDPRVTNELNTAAASPPAVGFIDVMLMECSSRGTLSAVGDEGVEVHANMLDTTDDCERMCFGVRRLAQLLETDAVRAICKSNEAGGSHAALGRDTPLSPAEIQSMSDDEIADWARANASDGIHASCSCRMGRRGATDAAGRLLGIGGVRIADASLLPTVPRANTHVTTIAVAEHIAAQCDSLAPRICPIRCCGPRSNAFETVAGWLFNEWPVENRAAGVPSPSVLADLLRDAAAEPRLQLPLTLVALGASVDDNPPEVLGTVRIDTEDLPSHDSTCAPWLAALYVPAAHRGQGLGAELCAAAADYAATIRHAGHQIERLSLWFPYVKEARLRPLYEGLGYTTVDDDVNSERSSFGSKVVVMTKLF